MKTLLLAVCLFAAGGGDREQGLQLYAEGKFAEAAAAFRAAIEHDGDAADLQWNLALASWRAGDLAAAETAAEKYAALAKHARTDLHRGMLGAVRHGEAQALEAEADALLQGAGGPPATAGEPEAAPPDPLPLLEQALAKARQAKDHFVAAAAAKATPELLRNTERTLRYVDELQKKVDELKQQREQKDDDKQQDEQDKKDEKQDEKDENNEKGEKKDDPSDPQQDPQDKQDQGDPGEPEPGDGQEPPEPQPQPKDGEPEPKAPEDPQDKDEPQPGAPEPPSEAKPEPPRHDAPGEAVEGKELTPEQAQRLLEQLKQLDGKLQQLRQGSKTGRRPVGRDW
jgi:tetratricopeptide (TPR) repeat protein